MERGLAASRERAQALILAGKVLVNQQKVEKAGTEVAADSAIRMLGEDLKYVTSEIERMGMLSSFERQMIHNVVDFRSVKVSDVMVHISAVVTVRPETTIEQLLDIFRRSGFDRYPVVSQVGNITGVVTVFDLIVDRPAISTVREYLRRILTVSPDEQAALVLRRLRASPIGLAAVVGASGHTVGIVSVEDLVNPLVKVPSEATPRTSEI